MSSWWQRVEKGGGDVGAAGDVQAEEGLLFLLVCPRRFAVKLSVGSMMAGGPTQSTWTVQKWKRWAFRRHAPQPIGRCRRERVLTAEPFSALARRTFTTGLKGLSSSKVASSRHTLTKLDLRRFSVI